MVSFGRILREYGFTVAGIAIGVAGLVALGAMAERIVRFIEGGDRFVLGQISVAGRGLGMGTGFTAGGLLRALQRRGDHPGHVVPGEELRDELGLLLAPVGEPVPGQAAVEDAFRVVHLAVPEEVHEGLLTPGVAHFDASGGVAAAASWWIFRSWV